MNSGFLNLGAASRRSAARALVVAIGAWLLVTGMLAALAIGPTVRGATHTVDIANFRFQTPALTIAVGDTVTWTNSDGAAHTVTSSDGTFDSGNLDPGQAFSFTFTTAGTFAYACGYHAAMTGTITVQAAAAAPSPTATAAQVPSTAMPSGEGSTATGGLLAAVGLLLIASATLLSWRERRARRWMA